jgi:starvation-inducible DNA-binding protein
MGKNDLRKGNELIDIATASLIENWIDETEHRTWFLFESSRRGNNTGH